MGLLIVVAVLLLLASVDRICWLRFAWGGAFRCQVRSIGEPSARWPDLGGDWTGRRWACWHNDELRIRSRLPWSRTIRLPARIRSDGVYRVPAWNPDLCGRRPVAVELVASDGARVEVAAHDTARLELVGPYVAAAMRNLPEAPVPGAGP
jgi:hypothetical protein